MKRAGLVLVTRKRDRLRHPERSEASPIVSLRFRQSNDDRSREFEVSRPATAGLGMKRAPFFVRLRCSNLASSAGPLDSPGHTAVIKRLPHRVAGSRAMTETSGYEL